MVKVKNGSETCATCPPGSFAVNAFEPCVSCPSVNSWSLAGSFGAKSCKCNEGYTGPDGSPDCAACAAGKFKVSVGSMNCRDCAENTYSSYAASSACTDCPDNSVSRRGSNSVEMCDCAAGFEGSEAQQAYRADASKILTSWCSPCGPGAYKATLGSEQCSFCPPYSLSPPLSTSVESCKCSPGYTGPDGANCVGCGPGKYKPGTGSGSCLECGPGKYSDRISVTSEAACVKCAADTYSPATAAISAATCLACKPGAVAPAGSSFKTDCKCSSGFSGYDGGPCMSCTAGTYKPTVGSSACTLCQAGTYSQSTAAITSSTCNECPSDSASSAGSGSVLDCQCLPGYAPQGNGCAACLSGSYKEDAGNVACTACEAGTYMLAGTVGATSAGNCIECKAGFFCPGDLSLPEQAIACPDNTTSIAGRTAATDCLCMQGYASALDPPTSPCLAVCGDGTRVKEEECDDANLDVDDGCTGCKVDCGFTCQESSLLGHDACEPVCGDSLQRGLEGCDDGNTDNGDGCSSDCSVELGFMCFHMVDAGEAPAPCNPSPSTCLKGVCGVGTITGNMRDKKECDDGNMESGDGCSHDCRIECGFACTGATDNTASSCLPTGCGDSKLSGGEACDDGNTNNGDGCSESCQIETGWDCSHVPVPPAMCGKHPDVCSPICGDGLRLGLELDPGGCDDGSTNVGDGCDSQCKVECGWTCTASVCTSLCGDGIRATGAEECDDGNQVDGDGCDSQCHVELGWKCEPYVRTAVCGIDQCSEVCGDGYTVGKEACDDADLRSGDGCNAKCAIECCFEKLAQTDGSLFLATVCGDGCGAGAEECDDGNTVDGDGCSSLCTVEIGWTCESSHCGKDTCVHACGDGRQGISLHRCDDGNDRNDDGCSRDCRVELGFSPIPGHGLVASSCGDGIWSGSEMCDDGNENEMDGCSPTCTIEAGFICQNSGPGKDSCVGICGDGRRVMTEECDDGNTEDGDGCDRNCKVENSYHCQWGSHVSADLCSPIVPALECESVQVRQAAKGSNDFGLVLSSNLLLGSRPAEHKIVEIVQADMNSWKNSFSASIPAMPDELYLQVPVFSAGTWVRIRIRAENEHGAGRFCELPQAVRLMQQPGHVQDLHLWYASAQDPLPLCISWREPADVGFGVEQQVQNVEWLRPSVGPRRALLEAKPVPARIAAGETKTNERIQSYKGERAQSASFLSPQEFNELTRSTLCFAAPAGTSWYFRIVACNVAGCGTFDSAPTASFSVPSGPPLPPPPPPQPGALRIYSVSPSRAIRCRSHNSSFETDFSRKMDFSCVLMQVMSRCPVQLT